MPALVKLHWPAFLLMACLLLSPAALAQQNTPPRPAATSATTRPPPEILSDPRALFRWRMQQVIDDKGTVANIYTVRKGLLELHERYQKAAEDLATKTDAESARRLTLAKQWQQWYQSQVAILEQILQFKDLEKKLYLNANVPVDQAQALRVQATRELPRLRGELKALVEKPPTPLAGR